MYSMILMMTMAAAGPTSGFGYEPTSCAQPTCCSHGFFGQRVPFYYRHFDPYYTAPGGPGQGLGYLMQHAGCLGYPMSFLDDRGGFGFTGAFVAPLVYRPQIKVSSSGYGFGYPQKIAPAPYEPPTPPDGPDPEKIDAPKKNDKQMPEPIDPVELKKELPDPKDQKDKVDPKESTSTSFRLPQSEESVPAKVIVQLPADAKLTINDRLTQQQGRSERVFQTPPLPLGQSFEYFVRIDLIRGGQTYAEAKRVQVRAGETTTVIFEEPRPATVTTDRLPPIRVPLTTQVEPVR